MTQPSGPYPTSAPAPAAVPPAPRVSPAGYWVGGAILVVGCTAAIAWFVVLVVGLINAPEDFDRLSVPGSTSLTLDDGDWMIYQEFSGADSGRYLAPPSIDVTDPDGRSVSLRTVSSDYSYDIGSYEGVGLYEFTAHRAGAYTIESSVVGEPTRFGTQSLAIGRPLFDVSNVGGILGSLALGAVSFITGLVVIIVTLVRRSRWKRSLRPAMAPYGSMPYGAPPYGQQAPYGAPPGYGPPPGYGAPQPSGGQPPYGAPPGAAPFQPPPAQPPAPSTAPAWPAPPSDRPPEAPGWAAPDATAGDEQARPPATGGEEGSADDHPAPG